jgi:hypothetical protein
LQLPAKRRLGRRILVAAALILYSITIFSLLDFAYSTYIHSAASPRLAVNEYDHGLRSNFDGYARFGKYRYRFYTNSLGFRDFSTRQVPLRSKGRRVLLIGDSFTEGMAVTFEDSYAGQLYQAGQRRQRPIEFLNAAVASYSPVIYYHKIKNLLGQGLVFDEVVVFSDISDVEDEATRYFCIDDRPEYRKYCRNTVGLWWQKHLVISYSTRIWMQYGLQRLFNGRRAKRIAGNPRAGWTIPGYQVGGSYAPLGIEGGITRSRQNMQELADFLRPRNIPLTIVVYPWPLQLELDDRDSRQERIWRDFCTNNCKAFVDLFPAFFAAKDAHDDWRRRLFIDGDVHPSVAGNRLMFESVTKYLLPDAGAE